MEGMDEAQLREKLADDPGAPEFADLADLLIDQGRMHDAFAVLFAGLSANPACHVGRLTLAKLFFQCDYLPFAVREIELLVREVPHSESLRKLFRAVSPGSPFASSENGGSAPSVSESIAEIDFDFESLDLLEKDPKPH